jgi:hypothetical protein
MWSVPIHNNPEDRGWTNDMRESLCVMLELTGVDPISNDTIDAEEKQMIDKLISMVMLISSQVILISTNSDNGLNDDRVHAELDFVQNIQKKVIFGAN